MSRLGLNPFWIDSDVAIEQDSLDVILLVHVLQPRGHSNPAQLQCSDTEHFSVKEFNEIYQGIVNAGYYIRAVFYNELDFIKDYMEHPEHFQNCLVYNLARNGLGNNKKTIIPAFCELLGIRYTTSSSLSCALCRNKYYFTTLLRAHDIPAPESWLLTETGTWANGSPPDGITIIYKPCSDSASQGVTEGGIRPAAEVMACCKGAPYIAQEYIDGEECEVPVFKVGNKVTVFAPVGIDLHGKRILGEDASAQNQYSFYHLGDTQPQNVIDLIRSYAEKAFRLMQMDVYGRVDFRLDSAGVPYIFDISTTPYTTKHSSFAFAFERAGFSYSDIYRAIITAALQRTGWALK